MHAGAYGWRDRLASRNPFGAREFRVIVSCSRTETPHLAGRSTAARPNSRLGNLRRANRPRRDVAGEPVAPALPAA